MFHDSFENELARQIYMRNGSVSLNKPLALSRPAVALRGNNDLDELETIHVKVLACLCENENIKESTIAVALDVEEDLVKECLHSLYLCQYVDEDWKPTKLGRKIVFEVGVEVLNLDKYYMGMALFQYRKNLVNTKGFANSKANFL